MCNCNFSTTFECINRYKAKRLFSFFVGQPPGCPPLGCLPPGPKESIVGADTMKNVGKRLYAKQLSVYSMQYGCDILKVWQICPQKSSSQKIPKKARKLNFHTEEHLVKLANVQQIVLKTDQECALTVTYILSFFIFLSNCLCVSAKAKNDLKGRDDNGTYTEEEETFWGQDMELSPMVWMMIVGSVVVFWIFLATFLACFCGPNFVECHLCEQQVPRNQWTRVDHRENCLKDHERFLTSLTKLDTRCPRCSARLRLWPKLGPKTFKCRAGVACHKVTANKLAMSRKRWKKKMKVDIKDKEKNEEDDAMMPGGGPEPVDVENTGSNRQTCFLCDFNICDKCVELIEAVESSNPSVMGSNLILPSSQLRMSRIVENVGGGNSNGTAMSKKMRRSMQDSSNSAAWNDAPPLKTISRDIELNQMNMTGNHSNTVTNTKNGITKVRPQ